MRSTHTSPRCLTTLDERPHRDSPLTNSRDSNPSQEARRPTEIEGATQCDARLLNGRTGEAKATPRSSRGVRQTLPLPREARQAESVRVHSSVHGRNTASHFSFPQQSDPDNSNHLSRRPPVERHVLKTRPVPMSIGHVCESSLYTSRPSVKAKVWELHDLRELNAHTTATCEREIIGVCQYG